MNIWEIIGIAGAVVVLIAGIIGDVKSSRRPNQPTHPKPEMWDKNFED